MVLEPLSSDASIRAFARSAGVILLVIGAAGVTAAVWLGTRSILVGSVLMVLGVGFTIMGYRWIGWAAKHRYDPEAHLHPRPSVELVPPQESPVFSPDASLLSMPELVPKDFTTGIEILNDRTTSMEFVIHTLIEHVGLERRRAIETMLAVHNTGGMLIATDTYERAVEIAEAVAKSARESGFQFVCRAVTRSLDS